MEESIRKAYPSDLTDEQWERISYLVLPDPLELSESGEVIPKQGAPPRTDFREVINAVMYRLRTGVPWRFLPHDFPPSSTVYMYFSRWTDDGTWEALQQQLRAEERIASKKKVMATAAIVDTQSVKATRGERRGYDGNKKVKGRKRVLLVDTLGLLIAVAIIAADVHDGLGGQEVLIHCEEEQAQNLLVIWIDKTFQHAGFPEYVEQYTHARVETKTRPKDADGFEVIPKRWIVERTNAWNSACRLLQCDQERTVKSAKAWIHIAEIHRLLKRNTKLS